MEASILCEWLVGLVCHQRSLQGWNQKGGYRSRNITRFCAIRYIFGGIYLGWDEFAQVAGAEAGGTPIVLVQQYGLFELGSD